MDDTQHHKNMANRADNHIAPLVAARSKLRLSLHRFAKKKSAQERMLNDAFKKEYCRSKLDYLFSTALPKTVITPVTPDKSFLHKLLLFLENIFMVDLVLVDLSTNKQTSALRDKQTDIVATDAVKMLTIIKRLKARKKRIFFVGHHEGYVGPYFLRTVIRRLGFDDLGANCNSIIGPKMLSNIAFKKIANNIGNSFLVLPSQKYKPIKHEALKNHLTELSICTQYLIKMPSSLQLLIENFIYEKFISIFSNLTENNTELLVHNMSSTTKKEALAYLATVKKAQPFRTLNRSDYEKFLELMYEPFLLFPEGSRSHILSDGTVQLKPVNPRYMPAFMRPGDIVVPVSLTGGHDALKGVFLRPAICGFSIGEPIEISSEMLRNHQIEGLDIMKKIAELPSLKKVIFTQTH
jgi:hypothetical protein